MSKTKEIVFGLSIALVSIVFFFGLPVVIDNIFSLEKGTTIGFLIPSFLVLIIVLLLHQQIRGVSPFKERLAKFRAEQREKELSKKTPSQKQT